jgi:hypothetical protein
VASRLFDHLNDAASAWVNQHWSIVYDGVAIFANTVFLRNFVVGDARFRKLSAHPYIALIAVRRAALFNYITAETRPLIYTQNACDAADNPSNRAADDSADRTGRAFAFAGTPLNAARHTLGCSRKWSDYSCGQKCRSDNLSDHLEPPI